VTLRAWSNGYEVVAAKSEEHAKEVLRAALGDGPGQGPHYEEDELDGDGWYALDESAPIHNEDGEETGQTVGDILCESPLARHLWSVAQ
jgi:hypothetical protein